MLFCYICYLKQIDLDMAIGVKTGGRKKGSPNKVTKDLRELLKGLLDNEMENMQDHLEKMEPKERLDFIVKVLPYVMPRYESVSFNNDNNKSEENSFLTLLSKTGTLATKN